MSIARAFAYINRMIRDEQARTIMQIGLDLHDVWWIRHKICAGTRAWCRAGHYAFRVIRRNVVELRLEHGGRHLITGTNGANTASRVIRAIETRAWAPPVRPLVSPAHHPTPEETTARRAEEALAATIDRHWARLDADARSRLRRAYLQRAVDDYPSVAHYAYAQRNARVG